MKITRMRVINYKSFSDSGLLELSPKLTVFVGENNAGKSALLQLFQQSAINAPHRSPRESRPARLGPSRFKVELTLSGGEWETCAIEGLRGKSQAFLPASAGESGIALLAKLRSEPSNWHAQRVQGDAWDTSRRPSRPDLPEGSGANCRLLYLSDGELTVEDTGNFGTDDTAPAWIRHALSQFVFFFSPQRYSIGRTKRSSVHKRLEPNAANLAGVLSGMYGRTPETFDRLVMHCREVLSTVGNLSINPHGDGNTDEVLVWPTHERKDENLAFALDECGTGVAQVIAILTAAMTMSEAVIAIDEISSFLHPSAAKALLRILLNDYPRHQYVVSTHSPEIIAAGSAGRVYFVRKSGFESSVQPVDFRKVDDIKLVTGQLGIALTDVFASDRIIWVEGPTEENCFPLLVEGGVPAATKFIAVVATGNFTSKASGREGLVYQVYAALAGATHSLVSSVTFSFDSEDLGPEKKAELRKRAKGRVLFLPRRNIESFLLDPEAVAEVINAEMEHFGGEVRTDPAEVRDAMELLGGESRFHAEKQWTKDLNHLPWLEKVDGANILAATFTKIAGGALEFSKTRHSPMILVAGLRIHPERLAPLRDYVTDLLALSATGGPGGSP